MNYTSARTAGEIIQAKSAMVIAYDSPDINKPSYGYVTVKGEIYWEAGENIGTFTGNKVTLNGITWYEVDYTIFRARTNGFGALFTGSAWKYSKFRKSNSYQPFPDNNWFRADEVGVPVITDLGRNDGTAADKDPEDLNGNKIPDVIEQIINEADQIANSGTGTDNTTPNVFQKAAASLIPDSVSSTTEGKSQTFTYILLGLLSVFSFIFLIIKRKRKNGNN